MKTLAEDVRALEIDASCLPRKIKEKINSGNIGGVVRELGLDGKSGLTKQQKARVISETWKRCGLLVAAKEIIKYL